MRMFIPGVILSMLVCAPAHAYTSDEHTLMDMEDEYEARQMGLDDHTLRMERMEREINQLRDQLRFESEQREYYRRNHR